MKIIFLFLTIGLIFSCRKDAPAPKKDYSTDIVGDYTGIRTKYYTEIDFHTFDFSTSVQYDADSALYMTGWSTFVEKLYFTLDEDKITVPNQNFHGEGYSGGGALIFKFDHDVTGEGLYYPDTEKIYLDLVFVSNLESGSITKGQISIQK